MKILESNEFKLLESLLKQIEEKNILETKATGQERVRFKVAGSVEMFDRHNEIVMLDGMDTSYYMKNAIVLQDHIYSVDYLIGKTDNIYKESNKLIFEGEFNDTEKGRIAGKLYKEGFLNTVSLGFIVKKRDEKNRNIILETELLELSFVVVPANREALREKGFNKEEIDIVFREFLTEDKESNKNKSKNKSNGNIDNKKFDLVGNFNILLNDIKEIKTSLSNLTDKQTETIDLEEFKKEFANIFKQ